MIKISFYLNIVVIIGILDSLYILYLFTAPPILMRYTTTAIMIFLVGEVLFLFSFFIYVEKSGGFESIKKSKFTLTKHKDSRK